MRNLDVELGRIRAREAMVEVDVTEGQIRRDGWLYGDARVGDVGVVLRFQDRDGRWVTMPSDRFTTVEGNVQALALTLERLRDLDRYGVARGGEQYTGWTAIGSGDNGGAGNAPPAPARMSDTDAARLLAGYVVADPEDLEEVETVLWTMLKSRTFAKIAVRTARAKTHPDAVASGDGLDTGAAPDFLRVQEAAEVLADTFGVAEL